MENLRLGLLDQKDVVGSDSSVNGSSQRTGCSIGVTGLIDATLKIGIISKETPADSPVVSQRGRMSQVVCGQGFVVASCE